MNPNRCGKKGKGRGQKHPDAAAVISALNHPIRRRIMRRLENEAAVRSPKDLSGALDMPIVNIAYHIRVLRAKCVIRLVRKQQKRGATEHFYSSNVIGDEQIKNFLRATAPQDERRSKP